MSRRYGRFVPTSTITARMDRKDLRFQREARARAAQQLGLAPEVFPYASVTVIPAVAHVEQTIEETQRASFRAFLTDPATGPKLDAAIADNAAVDAQLATVCAWCTPRAELEAMGPGISHGMCPACVERFEADDRGMDDDRGSRCSASCGFCGACS